jgi:hypothetical protein
MKNVPTPEQVFLENIIRTITNLLINNPNYTNTYYHGKCAFEVITDTQERARHILDKIEQIKHLIEPMTECDMRCCKDQGCSMPEHLAPCAQQRTTTNVIEDCNCCKGEGLLPDIEQELSSCMNCNGTGKLKYTLPTNQLQPISSAPKDGTYILLFGDSGYTTTPLRCEVGNWDAVYRPLDPWRTYDGDAFSDSGDPPTHWMPLPKK